MISTSNKNDEAMEEKSEICIVHCISGDFKCTKGFALEANRRLHLKRKLKEKHPHGFPSTTGCIRTGNIYNLVVKNRYTDELSYENLRDALYLLRSACHLDNVTNLAFSMDAVCNDNGRNPRIVGEMIQDIFRSTNVDVITFFSASVESGGDDL